MKRKDLRLLLSIGSSRTLFIASIGASIFWSALVIAHGFLIAQIIVGIIGRHPDVVQKIILLASLLLIRSIFQSPQPLRAPWWRCYFDCFPHTWRCFLGAQD